MPTSHALDPWGSSRVRRGSRRLRSRSLDYFASSSYYPGGSRWRLCGAAVLAAALAFGRINARGAAWWRLNSGDGRPVLHSYVAVAGLFFVPARPSSGGCAGAPAGANVTPVDLRVRGIESLAVPSWRGDTARRCARHALAMLVHHALHRPAAGAPGILVSAAPATVSPLPTLRVFAGGWLADCSRARRVSSATRRQTYDARLLTIRTRCFCPWPASRPPHSCPPGRHLPQSAITSRGDSGHSAPGLFLPRLGASCSSRCALARGAANARAGSSCAA